MNLNLSELLWNVASIVAAIASAWLWNKAARLPLPPSTSNSWEGKPRGPFPSLPLWPCRISLPRCKRAMILHELPTPRTTLRARYVRVLVWCKACRHRRDADLQALIDAGRGDVPLIKLRFRCSNCGSRLTRLGGERRRTRPMESLPVRCLQ